MTDKIQDKKDQKPAEKKPEELNQSDLDKAVGGWPTANAQPIPIIK